MLLAKKLKKKGVYRPAAALSSATAPPVRTFITSVSPSVAGLVATATSASIGTAAADRLVVVLVENSFQNLSSGLASVTADSGGGAVAMTQHTFVGQNGSSTGVFSLLITTGTTATIVATANAGGWASVNFKIYTITGLLSTTPTGSNSSGTTAASTSVVIATTSGGVIICAGLTQAASISNFSGSTETISIDNGTDKAAASATGIGTNASSTVNVNASASASIALSAVAWR